MIDRPAATVAAVGERALIRRLTERAGRQRPAPWVALDIGDDAALIEPTPGEVSVLSTDSLIEDIHFRRRWSRPATIGHKALAVNLSDLAAMGARPRACLLSLGLPAGLPLDDFDELLEGLIALADASNTPLVGGNIARSAGPLLVDVTVAGSVRRRRALRRAGGRAGDDLYVTGSLGGALAGLRLLEGGLDRTAASAPARACLERYERPAPRLRTGWSIGRQGLATAAIDLSDGLAEGLRELGRASDAGALVEASAIPIDPGLADLAAGFGADPLDMAIHGGEDYELLCAVPPRRRRSFEAAARRAGETTVTRIGRLTAQGGVNLARNGSTGPMSQDCFSHFIQ